MGFAHRTAFHIERIMGEEEKKDAPKRPEPPAKVENPLYAFAEVAQCRRRLIEGIRYSPTLANAMKEIGACVFVPSI